MAVTFSGNKPNVIQVVTGTTTTQVSFSTNSWVDIGLKATITPISSSSRILIISNFSVNGNSNNYGNVTIFRNGTNVNAFGNGIKQCYIQSGGVFYADLSVDWIDSPATTVPLTYAIYCMNGNNNGSMTTLPGAGQGNITLMELSQ